MKYNQVVFKTNSLLPRELLTDSELSELRQKNVIPIIKRLDIANDNIFYVFGKRFSLIYLEYIRLNSN